MKDPEKTGKYCSACGGALVWLTRREYQGDPMMRIYGPGSQPQMTTITETACSECGLMFQNGMGLDEPSFKKKSLKKESR